MDRTLQRYLDGITALLSIAAGELFALGLPAQIESKWLVGLGAGGLAWAFVAGYQRGFLANPGESASAG